MRRVAIQGGRQPTAVREVMTGNTNSSRSGTQVTAERKPASTVNLASTYSSREIGWLRMMGSALFDRSSGDKSRTDPCSQDKRRPALVLA